MFYEYFKEIYIPIFKLLWRQKLVEAGYLKPMDKVIGFNYNQA
ncbi:MAG: hypothetical protein PG981_001321 [Wolbachia endosymbiont of Ctenocephalides orientis wCori]|nr:MAG: hypothetical protein PG981_001321 [Wolbachia endosymbiont of Ctenocephalides orientis wCori]